MKICKTQKQLATEINAWTTLFDLFKSGEEVFVIDEDDEFYYGKFKQDTDCCKVGSKELDWEKIVFISHDGFPVRWLKTGVPSDFFLRQNTIKIQKRIRQLKSDWVKSTKVEKAPVATRRIFSWGDPYEIEKVIVTPFNIGGPMSDAPNAEFLRLDAIDGAVGLFYDIPSIWAFEAA